VAASNGTSVTGWNPVSRDVCALSVVMTVVAAIDRCGGHDGKEVLDSSDRALELALKVPDLTSEEEAVVLALVVRHVRMTSQA